MGLKKILERGYAKEIYEYALENQPYCDVDLLTKKIIESERMPGHSSYYLDDYDDDYDYDDEYEDEVVEYYIYAFARDIRGADINLLEDAIISKWNPEYLYLFAKDIKGADIKRLESALVSLAEVQDCAEYIIDFAADIPEANIELLQTGMKNADSWDIVKFAKNVPGANIEYLQDILADILTWAYECYNYLDLFNDVSSFFEQTEVANIDKMLAFIENYIKKYNERNRLYPSELYIKYLELMSDRLKEIKIKRMLSSIESYIEDFKEHDYVYFEPESYSKKLEHLADITNNCCNREEQDNGYVKTLKQQKNITRYACNIQS